MNLRILRSVNPIQCLVEPSQLRFLQGSDLSTDKVESCSVGIWNTTFGYLCLNNSTEPVMFYCSGLKSNSLFKLAIIDL